MRISDWSSDVCSSDLSGSSWTGFGGVGDYAWSNGNTQAVVDAAHGIRDRLYPDPAMKPVDEDFDLVIVGGGFSGMTARSEERRVGKECVSTCRSRGSPYH